MKEIILQIENEEKISSEKVKKEEISAKKFLEKKYEEIKNLLESKKKQNILHYKKEIENFKKELEKEKKDFKEFLKFESLKYEKNFKENNALAVSAIIEYMTNLR